MSASQYNNPYIYRKDLNMPKIQYPPMFDGLSKLSFKHVMDSKFLAIAGLLFMVGSVVTLICIVSPFWFKLVFSTQEGTFGSEALKRELSINSGIIFFNDEEFDNLMDINESTNQQAVPRLLVLAQLLEITGICSLVACLGATIILAFKKLASVTAYFILAFFSTITGLCLLFVFIFVIIMGLSSSCDPYDTGNNCRYKDNLEWRAIPIYSQRFRIEPITTPLIKLNWTAYIAIISPILVLAGSVLIWLEAFTTYRTMVGIRYRQLRTARDPHETDVDPKNHGSYVYKPPIPQGSMMYGMQPVTVQGGPYRPPPPPQGNVGFNVGFQDPGYSVGFQDPGTKRTPSNSSPPPRRRSPPPMRRRSPSPDDDSPGSSRRYSPPPYNGRKSPSAPPRRRSPSPRRRSPSPPPRRGGPPSHNSSMSDGPYISREIDL